LTLYLTTGDIYCLPTWQSNEQQIARPILQGVPHDVDPHFSPEGDRLVFRSDAELGYDNIWIIPWKGCEAMDLRNPNGLSELQSALATQATDESLLSQGIPETQGRKRHRLVREGRMDAVRVTNETFRYVSDARFHPSGKTVIATKWFTSEARSLGAGEAWEYEVPSLEDLQNHKQVSVPPKSGTLRVGRVLPKGWTIEEYGNQQIGPEQALWMSEDTVIYSKNVADEVGGVFLYNKGRLCSIDQTAAYSLVSDVHKGIYSIFSRNLTSGEDIELVSANPGGASRPELSQDGKTLAFVRRIRDKGALMALYVGLTSSI
jgi:hypothetical protein